MKVKSFSVKAFSTPLRAGKIYFSTGLKIEMLLRFYVLKSMILDFKLTRNSIVPTKYSVYKRLKPETDKLKQSTFRSMHHEKFEAWEFENLPRK